jgi:iron complex transport system ATP-binding protein
MKLEVGDVYFSYDSRPILSEITFKVAEAKVVSIIGPNGSGKTTLLKCIDRMLKPKRGAILVEEKDVSKLGSKEIAKVLSYVPQSAANVFPCTVFDAVLIGRRPHLSWGVGEKERKVVAQMLKLMGLDQMAMRNFNELSSGERQKVLLARALAQEPKVLLLDEPTSNLDLRRQLEVLGLLTNVVEERGIALVMAMHDLNLASQFSHQIIALREGKIYAAGEPESVLTAENIRLVYGVEAMVESNSGRPHIIPLRPIVERPHE